MTAPRTVLVGIGGYGRVHLQHALDFHRRGELALVAAVVFPPEPDATVVGQLRAAGCELLTGFGELLAALPRLGLQLAIVPTPIHLHAPMTLALVEAGVDVLVEKPLTASTAEAEAVAAAGAATGRTVAVGFQYLHAPEVRALRQRLAAGAIGEPRRFVVHAAWPRSHAYYRRNNWAGRLRLDGDWVLDSPVSNAMSHFLMVMLFLAGRGDEEVAEAAAVTAELYRAQAIESFDTAVLRMRTATGVQLDFYGTHSSRHVGRPVLRIEGSAGDAEWVQDGHARLAGPGGAWKQLAAAESDSRERMLRDVLARRRGEPAPICTPAMAAAHVRCFAGLFRTASIRSIPAEWLAQQVVDGQTYTFVPGLDEALAAAAKAGCGLAEMGAPWAQAVAGLGKAG